MDEKAIQLEMRLSAIEYLLCKVHLVTLLSLGAVRPDSFEDFAREFVAKARDERFSVGMIQRFRIWLPESGKTQFRV